jgi:hypothetical protein
MIGEPIEPGVTQGAGFPLAVRLGKGIGLGAGLQIAAESGRPYNRPPENHHETHQQHELQSRNLIKNCGITRETKATILLTPYNHGRQQEKKRRKRVVKNSK